MSDYESVLLVKPKVFVYRIPPIGTGGHKAADWNLDNPAWTGRMRLVSIGKRLEMRLEDGDSGDLYAKCPIDAHPGNAIETVADSSRYFVIRLMNDNGQQAFVGCGFQERGDAFDFNVSLQDHFRYIEKSAELEKQDLTAGPSLDLAFKEGQTISISIGKKDKNAAARPRPTPSATGGLVPLLPPPPGAGSVSSGVTVPPAGSATPVAVRRLQKDYAKLMQDPVEGIKALPNEDNILEWHYCLTGSPDTPFAGGYYWGKVIFKENFPWSPPAITMITPNGRFSTNTRLCLSISDYHPESWNPGWTVSAILIGLHSFMNENQPAAGAIPGTPQEQKNLALASKEFNCKYREFRRFFPMLVEEWTGVRPSPDEPNVAPVMLPEHATPSGIAVPSINNHSSRGAYAAAHHPQLGALDAQFEEMLNAVRGAAAGPRYMPPFQPFVPINGPLPNAGVQVLAQPGAPMAMAPIPEPVLPQVAMPNFQDGPPLNYNEYMGMAPLPPRQRRVPNFYGMPRVQPNMVAYEQVRRERLARFGLDAINGGPVVPRNQAGGNNEEAGAAAGGRRGNDPQNVATDVADGAPVPKRGRPGDDEVITLD